MNDVAVDRIVRAAWTEGKLTLLDELLIVATHGIPVTAEMLRAIQDGLRREQARLEAAIDNAV